MPNLLPLSQQRAIAIAPKPTSVLSILCSMGVALFILVSKQRRAQGHHRIILAISLHIILHATALCLGTAAVPAHVEPPVYGATGTIATCDAQGFINFSARFSLVLYYGCLPFLILSQVQSKGAETSRTRFLERIIHLICNIVPLIFSMIALQRKYFNPMRAGCFCDLNVFPHGCLLGPSESTCIRGDHGVQVIFQLSAILRILVLVVGLWALRNLRRVTVHSMKQMVPFWAVHFPLVFLAAIGAISYYTATRHKGPSFSFIWYLAVVILWPSIGIIHAIAYVSLRRCSWIDFSQPSSTDHNDIETQSQDSTHRWVKEEVSLEVQWSCLENVRYLASGGNCWINSVDYKKRPAVVKMLKPEYQSCIIAVNALEDELGKSIYVNAEFF